MSRRWCHQVTAFAAVVTMTREVRTRIRAAGHQPASCSSALLAGLRRRSAQEKAQCTVLLFMRSSPRRLESLGNSNLTTEQSYRNEQVVNYGERGSVRLDVVEGDINAPEAVYDLKTGGATLTEGRIAQIRANLPEGYQDIPVIEIRP